MTLNIIFKKLFRVILRLFFRFEWWHTSPLENKKYALDVIQELDSKPNRESILELGCGIGDIIGKVQYKKKYFYDISTNALKAAKFYQKITFKRSNNFYKEFNFFNESVNKNIHLDAIVLVNWIHGIESQLIYIRLTELINHNLKKGGVIIFDLIEDNPKYTFNHSVDSLIDINKFNIKALDGYRFGRKLIYATLR